MLHLKGGHSELNLPHGDSFPAVTTHSMRKSLGRKSNLMNSPTMEMQ